MKKIILFMILIFSAFGIISCTPYVPHVVTTQREYVVERGHLVSKNIDTESIIVSIGNILNNEYIEITNVDEEYLSLLEIGDEIYFRVYENPTEYEIIYEDIFGVD